MGSKKVENLVPLACGNYDTLADGAIVYRLSVQLNWTYVKVIKNGSVRRRRYRRGTTVQVLD